MSFMLYLKDVPEKFKKEGVFVHYREKVKAGDKVKAVFNVMNGVIKKGEIITIKKINIKPRGNERGFTKRLIFKEIGGEFNPKKFKKLIR